jgi:predicted transcriptional regulator
MTDSLKNHINKFIKINDEEFLKILKYFKVIDIDKKQNILEEGKICKSNYFVSTG